VGSAASGGSSATLSSLRDRVEQMLEDTTNTKFSTNAIDEAITQALDLLTQYTPHKAIAALTLSAAGREVDLSSLTYIDVERVWWDYDESDPTHPPNWRDFEVWPGDILFINDPDEPASGDVVRVWYTAHHTLNGLAGASLTTLKAEHESAIVVGAAGYVALSRAIDKTEALNIDGWTHRRLKEWAEGRIAKFEGWLLKIAKQARLRAAGIAAGPALDRWDEVGGW
jgi:hypothetical protein